MARILHLPELGPLHRLKKNGIIYRPRPSFSPTPCGEGQNLLVSNPTTSESRLPIADPKTDETTPPGPTDLTRLLLDPLADLSHQYTALERMQNEEVEKATLVLVQLRCHEYRSLWSTEAKDDIARMLQLYETLVEEVRTGRTAGMGGMRAGGGAMRDVQRELALGIRKAVRDGVRMARHSGPGAG